jgi:hypothetical protein
MTTLTPTEIDTLHRLLCAVLPSTSGAGAAEARAVDYVLRRLPGEDPGLVAALRAELPAAATDPPGTLRRWSADATAPQWRLFRRVRAWAWEGFLCDPAHGGNAGGVGWKRFGVAGAPQPAGFSPADLLATSEPSDRAGAEPA